jgi:hypothetical protein
MSDKAGRALSGYSAMIAGAIGVNDQAVLDIVEDVMRNDVFHSTLDWQSRDVFDRGARDAYDVYLASIDPVICAELKVPVNFLARRSA